MRNSLKHALKLVYSVYSHSIVSCGLMLRGNSLYGNKVFNIQKKKIACRKLFRKLSVIRLAS
jgi:hypothetical protein